MTKNRVLTIIGCVLFLCWIATSFILSFVLRSNAPVWTGLGFALLPLLPALPIAAENSLIPRKHDNAAFVVWIIAACVCIGGFLGWALTPTAADKREAAHRKVAKPTIQKKSTLIDAIVASCPGKISQLQQQMQDGATKFWIVLCANGTIKRVNPSDYGS